MRLLVPTAAALLLAASAASAAPAAPPAGPPPAPPSLPRLFAQAGYALPQIPTSACKTVNAAEAACTLPAMTAGRYFARATATSTATAAGAAQQITIAAGDQHCTSTWSPDPKAPWAVGSKRTFYAGCVFTIVTDEPMTVAVVYLDEKATKDPAGPTLSIYPQAWTGALSALPVAIKQ
ncbi:MAG TPA: hypothetical protein VN694_01085 [Caulobacteraceae bacterium]|nr:hypothetical protein [Caulobacteraceae bacterium]